MRVEHGLIHVGYTCIASKVSHKSSELATTSLRRHPASSRSNVSYMVFKYCFILASALVKYYLQKYTSSSVVTTDATLALAISASINYRPAQTVTKYTT